MITRSDALKLIDARGFTPQLLQHSLAAEAVLGALATRLGQDRELWALTGLLHDLDYPATARDPARHGLETAEVLQGQLPDEALQAIRAHNAEYTGHQPTGMLDYALRCGETVTGLIAAAALMRPTGYAGMGCKSIKKKMKDKAFAASVNRDNIRECEKIGLAMDDFLELAIEAMARQAGS